MEFSRTRLLLGISIILGTASSSLAFSADETHLPGLKVSENRRFLITEHGDPFFYLGDTAWELFHRLDRGHAEEYLRNRAERKFTVIQAVALAELNGLDDPNAYGHRPLVNNDPTQPDVKEGPDNDYWDHVDWTVAKANDFGLYIGLLPTWGDKWNRKRGVGPEVFTPQSAEVFGAWLGRRYQNAGVIWILGGDRPIETETHKEVIRAMARGLRKGDGGAHLMTFHPSGGNGSSTWFHEEKWLDFNMRQNGHAAEYTDRYSRTRSDYDRIPVKPVLDGEPIYEDHPVSFDPAKLGHSLASDVRRALYWNLFSGACGHTYGHHSVWQMWSPDKNPVNNPLMSWSDALHQPGAAQMQYGRLLMESRPMLARIPDDSIIVADHVPTSVPGAGRYRLVATRDTKGSYAMVYAAVGRAFKVRMDVIRGPRVNAWWFNPRNGEAHLIETFSNKGDRAFMPPDYGELLDWILVLDDVASNYPPPGQINR